MKHLSIDIETYSSVDIKKSGLYKYAQSPDFEILLFAYSFDDEPVQIVDLTQGEQIPVDVHHALFDPNAIKHAFNAPFEWYCLSQHYMLTMPEEWLSQWRCTMMHGLYAGYTSGLGPTGEAMGIPQDKRKLGVGGSLIRTFCVPTKPTKSNGQRTRTLPHHEPEKWELFKDYCVGDVIAEKEMLRRLSFFPVPEQEQRLWEIDQRINAFGVKVDLEMVDGALAIEEIVTAELMQEAVQLSGLDNPKSVTQLRKWLEKELGEEVDNLRKDTVSGLIETVDEGAAKRVLEIRQELSKASVKKYAAMRDAACEDSRIRGLMQFYGANRTGRWAGRIVQPQNLPRNYLSSLEYARQLVVDRQIDLLRFVYGNVQDALSQLIRTAFVPSSGNVLIVSDFSAIEARVIAWLAGEQWRLNVFNSHGKIYEASASQMFGVPIEQIDRGSDLRQKGKVAELALGYQGGPGALISMGALSQGLTEAELPEIVMRWRNANRRICDLWFSLEAAALEVMQNGQPVGIRGLIFARESHYGTKQDFFTIQLPSGRKLYYPQPFLSENDFGKQALHYYSREGSKWSATSTYGGKLTENVVQAIARDCLATSLVRLDVAGYKIAFHVHDEVVLDVPESIADLGAVTSIMGQPISWASGLPLAADGFITKFYMKD